ncbi:MAG: SsrA-binding protein SmpB [Candidatus Pacebacteria bacterium]|nr:SsrA-binding protein SmpB [Candidatus Paceibacterota bacterium]
MPTFVTNKKAHFNYEILERYEAGIELLGFEVKSIRASRASLDGSHMTMRGGEAFLIGSSVTPLQPKNTPGSYDERRNRKLLLTKKEIADLGKKGEQKGLTIVPLSMYNKKRTIKVEIAVVRGKKKRDKRESLKKREAGRDIERTLKGID